MVSLEDLRKGSALLGPPCQKIKLSSSDGTYLTVSNIKDATSLLRYAYQRLTEINEGTYMRDQGPIPFDADTSQELLDAVFYAQEAVLRLVNYILHDE